MPEFLVKPVFQEGNQKHLTRERSTVMQFNVLNKVLSCLAPKLYQLLNRYSKTSLRSWPPRCFLSQLKFKKGTEREESLEENKMLVKLPSSMPFSFMVPEKKAKQSSSLLPCTLQLYGVYTPWFNSVFHHHPKCFSRAQSNLWLMGVSPSASLGKMMPPISRDAVITVIYCEILGNGNP